MEPRLELMNSIGCLHRAKHSSDMTDTHPDGDEENAYEACGFILFGNIIDSNKQNCTCMCLRCSELHDEDKDRNNETKMEC